MTSTRVTEELTRCHANYTLLCDNTSGIVSGMEIAEGLKADPNRVFKTLIMCGKSGSFYVFMIPVTKKLSSRLSKEAAGERLRMCTDTELSEHAGYVHGGCSPVALKEEMKVFFDSSASAFEKIIFGAGENGYHVELNLRELSKAIEWRLVKLCE